LPCHFIKGAFFDSLLLPIRQTKHAKTGSQRERRRQSEGEEEAVTERGGGCKREERERRL